MLATAPDNRTIRSTAPPGDQAPSRVDVAAEELAIVRQAQHRPEAFAPLYERYVDAIFGYCYRRTSDREVAADLTHQIFTKILTALPQFTERAQTGSFRSWLFSIAHNLVIDTHRTRKDTASLDQANGSLALHDQAQSPEDQALASEQRRILNAAMGQLTAGQRRVVELRLAGLTGPEIADLLDLQLAAVKSTQFRAYARLRELLGNVFAAEQSTSSIQEPTND